MSPNWSKDDSCLYQFWAITERLVNGSVVQLSDTQPFTILMNSEFINCIIVQAKSAGAPELKPLKVWRFAAPMWSVQSSFWDLSQTEQDNNVSNNNITFQGLPAQTLVWFCFFPRLSVLFCNGYFCQILLNGIKQKPLLSLDYLGLSNIRLLYMLVWSLHSTWLLHGSLDIWLAHYWHHFPFWN